MNIIKFGYSTRNFVEITIYDKTINDYYQIFLIMVDIKNVTGLSMSNFYKMCPTMNLFLS